MDSWIATSGKVRTCLRILQYSTSEWESEVASEFIIISVLLVHNSVSCCFYFLVLGAWNKWRQCAAFAFERIVRARRGKVSCVLRWQSTCCLFRWHYFNPELEFWLFYWKETGNYTSGWNLSLSVFFFNLLK